MTYDELMQQIADMREYHFEQTDRLNDEINQKDAELAAARDEIAQLRAKLEAAKAKNTEKEASPAQEVTYYDDSGKNEVGFQEAYFIEKKKNEDLEGSISFTAKEYHKTQRDAYYDKRFGCLNSNSYLRQFSETGEEKDINITSKYDDFTLTKIDLGAIKQINDIDDGRGYNEISNPLIQSFIDAVSEQYGKSNFFRIGGDEFVIVFPNEKKMENETYDEYFAKLDANDMEKGLAARRKMKELFQKELDAYNTKYNTKHDVQATLSYGTVHVADGKVTNYGLEATPNNIRHIVTLKENAMKCWEKINGIGMERVAGEAEKLKNDLRKQWMIGLVDPSGDFEKSLKMFKAELEQRMQSQAEIMASGEDRRKPPEPSVSKG